MKSNLKGCITKGFGKSWVDDDSDRLLADAIAGMKRLSIPETCRAFALLDCVIQKIRGDSGGLHTLYDDQWMSITQHSRASMMRAQDRADGKIRKSDIIWLPDGSCIAYVEPGKCHTSREPTILYYDEGNFSSPAFCLRRYWDRIGMDQQPADAYLYPLVDPITDQVDWSRHMTNAQKLSDTRRRARVAGMPEKLVLTITGHSDRSGGCTDLVMAGVPAVWIKKQGRWRSDAFMVYFRLSQYSMHYIGSRMFSHVYRGQRTG